jgi:hypothetical protein
MKTTNNIKEGKLYAGVIPQGAEIIGTVDRSFADKGALVKLASGVVVQMNAGVIRSLPNERTP